MWPAAPRHRHSDMQLRTCSFGKVVLAEDHQEEPVDAHHGQGDKSAEDVEQAAGGKLAGWAHDLQVGGHVDRLQAPVGGDALEFQIKIWIVAANWLRLSAAAAGRPCAHYCHTAGRAKPLCPEIH